MAMSRSTACNTVYAALILGGLGMLAVSAYFLNGETQEDNSALDQFDKLVSEFPDCFHTPNANDDEYAYHGTLVKCLEPVVAACVAVCAKAETFADEYYNMGSPLPLVGVIVGGVMAVLSTFFCHLPYCDRDRRQEYFLSLRHDAGRGDDSPLLFTPPLSNFTPPQRNSTPTELEPKN